VSTAACLIGYGVVAAAAAPLLLAPARTARTPRLGVVGWFVAVSTVLVSWLAAAAVLVRGSDTAMAVLALLAVLAVAVRIGWSLAGGIAASRSRRRRHRDGLAVLGRHDQRLGITLIDSPEVMVYCVPGTPGTVVVTTAARDTLSRRQLRAVLSHEHAHLAGHHTIVVAIGYAISRALPWLAVFRDTGEQVAQLLEMRADDVAARRYGARTVAAALAAMSIRPAPAAVLAASGPQALARATRLCTSQPRWRRRRGWLAMTLTVAALATGPYLAAVAPWCPHPFW
jgi:Zn-dependent protease with chaperone function